jgi:hypothetical protein
LYSDVRHNIFWEAVCKLGRKSEEVRAGCIKLHNGELCDLYTLLHNTALNKSRRMKWAGHGTCMGRTEKPYRVLVGNPAG